MKHKLLLTVIAVFSVLFASAQEDMASITVNISDKPLSEAVSIIEKASKYTFFYDAVKSDMTQNVSLSAVNMPVEAAMKQLLAPTDLKFEVKGNQIVLLSPSSQMIPPTVTVTVFDKSNYPVAGAAILKDDGTGEMTDIDGKAIVSLTKSDKTLRVMCLGYATETVMLGASDKITVYLADDTQLLEEVVVVGYGTTKKENLTGAVSVVTSDAIGNRSRSNLGQILQGTVPGMTVTTSSGQPGQGVSLNIRGWNSINSGSPLVLVDGVAGSLDRVNPNDVESISVLKDASSAAVYGAQAAFGVVLVTTKSGADNEGFANISYSGRFGFTAPTSSTDWETRGYDAVYAANLFTQSYTGQPQIRYSEDDMYQLWIRRDDVVEHPDRPWIIMDQSMGRDTYKYYANTDWWHYFFNDIKPTQSHDISFRGGTKNVKYFLSGNYSKEQGIYKQNPDIHDRYNLRARISFDATKWLNISNNAAYYSSVYTYPGAIDPGDTFYVLTAGYFPYLTPLTPDGNYLFKDDFGGGGQYYVGILDNKNYKNRKKTGNFTNTVEATIKPIEQLEIKGNYTYSANNYLARHRHVNLTYASTIPGQTETLTTGVGEDMLQEQFQTIDIHSANVFATYTDTFKAAHNLKVMVGGNYETYNHKTLTAKGYDLLSDELNDMNLVSADETGAKRLESTGGLTEYALMGFFGRINYDYKGKYLVEVSGRYDGSSRFPKGQRWGIFPSFSVGWRISEENFFSPMKSWWNDAKLRFSYGSLGNQQVGYYDYIRSVSLGTQSYLFGGDKSAVATYGAPVSSNLTWETVSQSNLGLDLAFLNNRLTFSGEAYIRDTKNMLTTGKALPSVYGAKAPKTNNADLRTKGYELALTWRDRFMLFGQPFDYSVTATLNDYVGEITKFDNPTKDLSTYYEGMRYGEIWGYVTDGLFASDDEARSYPVDQSPVCAHNYSSTGDDKGLRAGDLKYVDLPTVDTDGDGIPDAGDGIIGTGSNTVDDPGDRRIIGNSQPRYQYGLTLGFNFYGFDFSIFFQGIGHQDWYPGNDARYFWGLYARPFASWIQKDFLDRCWSEDNPDAYFPRPRAYAAFGKNDELGAVNDRYLQNIGYCRLKNLTFGYTLPKKWTDSMKMNSLRIYFSGENIACISPGLKCDYMDPEMAMVGGKCHIYPWQKTFMFGVDINF